MLSDLSAVPVEEVTWVRSHREAELPSNFYKYWVRQATDNMAGPKPLYRASTSWPTARVVCQR
jgi:hypothetical protein